MAFFKFGNSNKMVQSLKSKLLASRDNAIIHNKFILYFIFLLSLGNLFYLSVERDFMSIAVFVLVGFLTSFFSKNMLIILFVALTIANILKYGSNIVQEGATNQDESEEEETKKTNEKSADTKKSSSDKSKASSSDKKTASKDKKSSSSSDSKTEATKDKFDPTTATSELVETLKSMSKIAESLKNNK